jgi:hypothetical protein
LTQEHPLTDAHELISVNPERPADTSSRDLLPPIFDGCYTLSVEEKVRRFVLNVPELLERWISRRASPHTQRAYRQDLFTFLRFAGIAWPNEATELFAVTVGQVHAYRDWMIGRGDAPKTINRRISSLSGFFKFLREVAAEMRLPIQVANPAEKEFVARDKADPVEERHHFSAAKARQLFSLPAGETVLDYRDRAILKCLLFPAAASARCSGWMSRISTTTSMIRSCASTRKDSAAVPLVSTFRPRALSANTSPRPS